MFANGGNKKRKGLERTSLSHEKNLANSYHAQLQITPFCFLLRVSKSAFINLKIKII